ncbi:hypothetical protein G7023_21870 [Pseudomonas stutzeri]|nr:hypothetical protein [Stutzerimonas stutzeri]
MKQIRELHAGQEDDGSRTPQDAVEIARSRKWIARSSLLPGATSEAGQQKSRCVALATDGSNQTNPESIEFDGSVCSTMQRWWSG